MKENILLEITVYIRNW